MSADRTILQERLLSVVRRFSKRHILVVGDAIADQFVYGGISRVSREAPVFIIHHEHTETVPGGAANCAANLAALGAKVSLVGFAGDDEAGRGLIEKLRAADVDCGGVITTNGMRTTTKVRIVAGQSHSTRQQVVRIDYETDLPAPAPLVDQLCDLVRQHSTDKDAVIISDYNYGVLSPEMIQTIRNVALHAKFPVLVDSRFKLMSFSGFTSATPNEAEVEHLLRAQSSSTEDLMSAGEELREKLGYRALLITCGSQGMILFEEGVAPLSLEAVGSHEPVDVTGAGDTVIAIYTLALASDASFSDAARLANYAGGLVVMKRGTASVSASELEHSILHSE